MTNDPKLKPLVDVVYILEPCQVQLPNVNVSHSVTQANSIKLSHEFGKSEACKDLELALRSLSYQDIRIKEISLYNYKAIVCDILQTEKTYVVFNLCDGCETDGYPGISILKELHSNCIPYTGADPKFYEITTSKPLQKRELSNYLVPTAEFVEINEKTTEADVDELGFYPLIIKPSISYASISIDHKSIVFSAQQALTHAKNVVGADNGVFAERFLAGREFTVFIAGDEINGVKVYPIAERVFDPKLAKFERILAFDKYWDGFDLEGHSPKSSKESIYWYSEAPEEHRTYLATVAKNAYLALNGNGYGRVDIRTESMESMNAFVLEVNANCGLSFKSDASSTILKMMRQEDAITTLVHEMISLALCRQHR